MAYKFQKGAFHADGLISGSSTGRFDSSISSSGDLAVTGAIHANKLYGDGGALTGISADAIDVTASAADQDYRLVFTQDAQSDGSLGLGLSPKFILNPSANMLSASTELQITRDFTAGKNVNISGTVTVDDKVSASSGFESVVFLRTAGSLAVTGNADLKGGATLSNKISGSSGAEFVGTIRAGGNISTSGSFTTTDVTYGDTGITIDSDGGHFVIEQEDEDKQVRIVLGSNGENASSAFNVRNHSGSVLFGVGASGSIFMMGNATEELSASIGAQFKGTVKSIGAMASSGSISGAAGNFEGITGTSLALQSGGITAAGAIAGATTIAASGLANLDGGIEIDNGGNKFTVSTAGAVVAEGSISGAAGNFDAITGVSLNLQEGGISNAGAIAGATTIDASGDLTVGSITGPSVFSVDASGDVIVDSIKTNGNEFVVSTAGLCTTTGLTNAGAVISSSHAAEIVGNSVFVGAVGVTGALTLKASASVSSITATGSISGSSTAVFASSISSSGDLAVTGAVHAASLYGDGSGITGISSDAVDVTSSTGNRAYPLVFTQDAQTAGTLGLALNTGLEFNPATLALAISGHSSGKQFAEIDFCDNAAYIKRETNSGEDTMYMAGKYLNFSASAGEDGAIFLLGPGGGVVVENSKFVMEDNSEDEVFSVSKAGAVSGASGLEIVGNSNFVGTLKVTGAVTAEAALDVGGLANLDGGIEIDNSGNKFTVSTAGAVVAASSISGAAGNFEGITGTSLALQSGGITAAGAIAGATTLAASGLANLDGGIEIDNGGNKFTVSTAGAVVAEGSVSGAAGNFDAITGVSLNVQLGGISNAGAVAGVTTLDATGLASLDGGIDVNGSNFVVSTAGLVTTTGITNAGAVLSSSHAAEIVGNSRFVGTVGVTGALSMDGGANLHVKTYTGAASLGTSQIVHIVSGGTAALTMTLPSIGTEGRWIAVKRHNNMSGNVVVDGADSELIDGNANITLSSAGASVYLVDDGTQWVIL